MAVSSWCEIRSSTKPPATILCTAFCQFEPSLLRTLQDVDPGPLAYTYGRFQLPLFRSFAKVWKQRQGPLQQIILHYTCRNVLPVKATWVSSTHGATVAEVLGLVFLQQML